MRKLHTPAGPKPDAEPQIPSVGEGKRGAEGHLAYLLRQASVALRAHLEREISEFGVTQAQFAVMTMMAAYPGLSNADLARLSLLTPQTLSVTVSNLRRDGLVVSRPHPVHGRIKTLELSPRGMSALARGRSRITAIEKRLAAGLTAKQELVVRKWLTSVAVACTKA